MSQYEPYYPFVAEMVNKGIFDKAEIENKNILILGRYTVEGFPKYIETELRRYFMQNGAKKCVGYGIFPGADVDVVGNLDEVADKLGDEQFDLVFLLEGLEKTKNISRALSQIKRVCNAEAVLLVMTRTPNIRGTELKLNYYEDYWRYDRDVVKALFSEFCVMAEVSTDADYFIAMKLKKTKQYHDNLLDDTYIYNNWTKNRKKLINSSYNEGYFSQYKELDILGDKTKTDKSSYDHNYLDKYEFFLRKFKDEEIKLLELGIYGGSSLRLWKEYFSKAQIYGVDIMDACKHYEEERIKIIIADLSSEMTLQSLQNIAPNIIVDDASHLWSHQIKALFYLFSSLPHGGVYIIEDMETSVNADMYPGYGDFPMSAYDVCSRIARVVAGKNNCDDSVYKEYINTIGMETELISIMKGSCVLIKR